MSKIVTTVMSVEVILATKIEAGAINAINGVRYAEISRSCGQLSSKTGKATYARTCLVASPNIICLNRLCV